MQDIYACLDRLDKLAESRECIKLSEGIEARVSELIVTGPGDAGLTSDVLAFVERVLGIVLYKDIRETFKRYNGLFMGIDIFCLEKCLSKTLQCREKYTDRKRQQKLKKSIVISDDGCGNPILISETGQLYIFHHDDVTFEVVEKTYITIFDEFLKHLENPQ